MPAHTVVEPWRVRIRDQHGEVRGAGLLLATGQILTCAHVVHAESTGAAPTEPVTVEFVSVPGTPTRLGTVAAHNWVPVHHDMTGDIAVLDLDTAPPDVQPAPLRRMVGWGRQVHAFGFPDGAQEYGVNAVPVLSGPGGPGGEWMQLDSPSDDRRITAGFSGAAVVDHDTGAVLGIVVMEYVRNQPAVSWMIPVETILRHLPGLTGCVTGGLAVDKELTGTDPADTTTADETSREYGLWFRRTGRPVRLVVTGDVSSSRSSGLRRMILLADRELRPAVQTGETDPPVGGVDLAMEAGGKTVEALRGRIEDRFGSTTRAAATIVVDGVDDAVDPERLLREVLKPLADHDTRLLLGFRGTASPAWALATSLWPEQDRPDDHPNVLSDRLADLAGRVLELSDREDRLGRHRTHVAARVADAPEAPARAFRLGYRVAVLRGVTDPDPALVARAELSLERANRKCWSVWRELDVLLERRRELRGRLEAYHAMAADLGRAEDPSLDGAYRAAHAEVHRRPADLAAALTTIDAYRAAIGRSG